ncbi:MAG TPA: PP2C family serine/threonine-protein phosphatase [Candidatus Acidoferrales bacterium]|nr:PP2C family serine/threonine-protein phosphatase [Candidatus Acidoferrales bacterium]
MGARSGIEFAQLTDVGLLRERNEDSYSYWEPQNEDEFRRKGRLAVVADGMGGHDGGQLASDIAVRTLNEVYRDSAEPDPPAALASALRQAHERIRSYALAHPVYRNMGTTCTAAVLRGNRLWFAHVGDSRLYLIHDGSMRRLTRDHSYVNQLVEYGIITSDEAERHPQRNVLIAALGIGRDDFPTEIPSEPTAVEPGDTLVLCTDGLWTHVADLELLQMIHAHPPADACRELVRLAKDRGGTDNITIEILHVDSAAPR